MSIPVLNNSQIYLGSQVSVLSSGDLSIGSANIVSSVLDNRFSSVSSALSTEVARAISSETVLASSIVNQVAIEYNRAFQAEGVLSSNVASVNSKVDAILVGSTVSSDTLKECMDFSIAVKALEISDVISLTTKVNTLQLAIPEIIKLKPVPSILADSTLPVLPSPVTSLYDGWYINKANDSSNKK